MIFLFAHKTSASPISVPFNIGWYDDHNNSSSDIFIKPDSFLHFEKDMWCEHHVDSHGFTHAEIDSDGFDFQFAAFKMNVDLADREVLVDSARVSMSVKNLYEAAGFKMNFQLLNLKSIIGDPAATFYMNAMSGRYQSKHASRSALMMCAVFQAMHEGIVTDMGVIH